MQNLLYLHLLGGPKQSQQPGSSPLGQAGCNIQRSRPCAMAYLATNTSLAEGSQPWHPDVSMKYWPACLNTAGASRFRSTITCLQDLGLRIRGLG